MRARPALLAPFVLASAASGCIFGQSRQARTYVLDPLPALQAKAASAASPVAVVGVLEVSVPGWVDRPQITGRSASGEVVSDEYARWGEPITRGLKRVLTENLALLLPERRLVAAPFPPDTDPDQRIDVEFSEAARQADGSVLVEARWAVLDRRGETLARGRASQRAHTSGPGASAAVAGVNEALAGLSREIADAMRGLPVPKAAAPADPQR